MWGWERLSPVPRCGRASSTGGCGVPRGASPRCRPERRNTTPPRAGPRLAPTPTHPPRAPSPPHGLGGPREPCPAPHPWPYPAPLGCAAPLDFRETLPPLSQQDGGQEEVGTPRWEKGVAQPPPRRARWPGAGSVWVSPLIFYFYLFLELLQKKNCY